MIIFELLKRSGTVVQLLGKSESDAFSNFCTSCGSLYLLRGQERIFRPVRMPDLYQHYQMWLTLGIFISENMSCMVFD